MEPDYYEVLEVASDATREEIKASYRRAVREHHPDAAPAEAKEAAHEKIQVIISAWTILSEPSSRLAYDERRRRAQAQAPLNLPQGEPAAGGRAEGRGERRGVDEPPDARKRSRVQAVMGGTSSPRPVNPRTKLLAMVFDAAQMYHVEGRPDEAARVCQQVLRADPTNAEAAVLLADIYAAQNQRAAALDLLERALRLQPANALYRSKWEALRHAAEGRAPGSAAPAAAPRASAPNPWSKAAPQRPLASRIVDRGPGSSAWEPTAAEAQPALSASEAPADAPSSPGQGGHLGTPAHAGASAPPDAASEPDAAAGEAVPAPISPAPISAAEGGSGASVGTAGPHQQALADPAIPPRSSLLGRLRSKLSR